MTEIDDEMINRAAIQLGHGSPHNREDVRRALEAALSPKPEPEIEVTDQMASAGGDAIYQAGKPNDGIAYTSLKLLATKAYRAMRAIEPKAQEGAAYAAKPAPQGVSAGAPVNETGGGVVATTMHHSHMRSGDDPRFKIGRSEFYAWHRRSTDRP